MMRKLFIANTYYQLIIAIQMANSVFLGYDNIMLFSDHSKKALETVVQLQRSSIFSECQYIKTKKLLTYESYLQKMREIYSLCFLKENRYSVIFSEMKNKKVDEIICFNFGIEVDAWFSYLSSYNKDLKISRYEEGILSYGTYEGNLYFKRRRIISGIRRLLGKVDFIDAFDKFYCYYPELYKGNWEPVQVPVITSNSKTASDLKKIFNIKHNYKQKYIFFTSVLDFEGGEPIGEYELVCRVAELVGKDNLLVKTHPRDTRTIYSDNGFYVDENSSIPWEAIQLSGDFSDKVFLTVNSGSVLSGSTMSEKPVKTFYMYKICKIEGNPSCQENAQSIENLLAKDSMKEILKNVRIAEKLEDIL